MRKIVRTIVTGLIVMFLGSAWSQKQVFFKINHKLGNEVFALNQTASNNLGKDFKYTRVAYYISGIKLVHDGGQVIDVNKFMLVQAPALVNEDLGSHNITQLEEIRFSIGVSMPQNEADPALQPENSPLALQSPSMHWGWQSGYRFLVLEGKSGANFGTTFQLHALDKVNYFQQVHQTAGLLSGNTLTVSLDADYTLGLKDINVATGPISHGTNAADLDALKNFKNFVFKVTEGTNSLLDLTSDAQQGTIYPNPSDGIFHIKCEGLTEKSTVKVMDIQGKLIPHVEIDQKKQINLVDQQKGLYFIEIFEGNKLILRDKNPFKLILMKRLTKINTISIFASVALFLLVFSCKKAKAPVVEPYVNTPYELDFGSLPETVLPSDNKLTTAGVQLGRMLFYDKDLSRDGTQACASCHVQKFAFSDTARFSTGVRGLQGKRQAMSIFNMAWHSNEFFWDGRAHLLRDQALKPIQDELEMDETLANVIAKLKVSPRMYASHFELAFGSSEISELTMSKALEQFMNSIVSNRSRYDLFLNGQVQLTELEERGRVLFFTEYNPGFPNNSGADCFHCHTGANFENDLYMNNGLDTDGQLTDIGRQKVTNNVADRGAFKVTSLRNIELTPPYMHDGRFKTLEAVVNHYNLVKQSSSLDPVFQQQFPNGLMLTQHDKQALVAFLKTLTDQELINDKRYSNPF